MTRFESPWFAGRLVPHENRQVMGFLIDNYHIREIVVVDITITVVIIQVQHDQPFALDSEALFTCRLTAVLEDLLVLKCSIAIAQ